MTKTKSLKRYHKLEIECTRCKTHFEIWLSDFVIQNGVSEEAIRKHFYKFCPVCKELERLKKSRKKKT